jgi:iron complex outermembrane receptor protein
MKKRNFSFGKTMFFKRFLRKSYAAFNSLKREVCISVLPVACLAFVNSSNALSQTHEAAVIEHNLEEIEVWGREVTLESRSLATGMISVIPREQIDKMPVQTIQGLLEFAGNIDVRQRGGNGVQADVSFRGSSSDQIVVLLNGVNITDPQTGHYNLNIPIDLSSVSRVEILHGSGARALGVSSFGGAINIITGEAEKTGANFEITGGSYGFIAQNANFSLVPKGKNFTSFASVNHQRSEGYIDNTDFSIFNAYLHSAYSSKKSGKFQFQFGFQDKGHGANSFYSFAYPNQYDKQSSFFSTLEWRKKITNKAHLSAQAYWRELNNRFELFRNFENAPDFYTGHNYHQTNIFGGELKFNNIASWGKTTAGLGVKDEHIYSNVLGEAMAIPRPLSNKNGIFFTHEKNRFLTNVFAEQAFYIGKFTIAGGLIANYNNDYNFNLSGGIDIDYAISSNFKAFATANHGYRLPTFTDLYYNTATHIANHDLKPEKANIYEAGLKYFSPKFRANASVFYRTAKDVVDWVRMPGEEKWQSRNHTEINALGTDIWLQYIMPENKFLRQIKLSYSFMTQDKNAAEFESKYALEYLNHKATLFVYHEFFKKLHFSWNIIYRDRNGTYADYQTNEIKKYKSVFLVNARLQWTTNKIAVYFDADNIFNTKYVDFGGLVQSGTWLKTGIKVRL